MLAIFCNKAWNVRHLHYVVGDKGRQAFHAQKFIGFMERQVNAVNADAVEELFFIFKGLQRCVPGQGKHIGFALNQAAGTVFLFGVGAGAAIAGIQRTVAFCEDIINVLLHGPGRAHPPAGHLVNHGVGPEVFFHFGFYVVFAVGTRHLNIMSEGAQIAFRDLGQGVV